MSLIWDIRSYFSRPFCITHSEEQLSAVLFLNRGWLVPDSLSKCHQVLGHGMTSKRWVNPVKIMDISQYNFWLVKSDRVQWSQLYILFSLLILIYVGHLQWVTQDRLKITRNYELLCTSGPELLFENYVLTDTINRQELISF